MLQVALPTLHPAQQIIHDSPARFKVLACGRRFGKTLIAIDAISDALLDGKRAAYFAPTFRMGAEVFRDICDLLQPVIRYTREEDWRIELHTGGVFDGWSLSQNAGETVRGRSYHLVVMDEAALYDSDAVWHGAIRPLLTDYAGKALFCGTPRGRNWFWNLYLRGQSAAYPDWESWRFPTSANPHIDPAEIESARDGMPERFFQQEYDAVFLDDGGTVFRNIDAVCTAQPGEYADETCFIGVDWGRDNDFTCISVMTASGRQLWLERFNQIGWHVQRARLAELYHRYRPRVVLAEENSIGSVNIDALRQEGIHVQGFMTTAQSKPRLIDEFALALEREEITLLDDETLRHELAAYAMTRHSHGWSYSAPPGGHDDTVIATALSLHASRRYGGPIIDFV